MALHDDLLEQARHLATRERTKPRQAILRRAVSAAYYALFHLLADDGARRLSPPEPRGLRQRIIRTFSHGDMLRVCKGFGSGQPARATKDLLTAPLEVELTAVATAFVELQQARHEADYDTAQRWNRPDVLGQVGNASRAFKHWSSVRATPNASVFLAALLLQKGWER